MFSFISSSASRLSSLGSSYSQLNERGQQIVHDLRELRLRTPINYHEESRLIDEFAEIERRKAGGSIDASYDMSCSGLKSLIPGSTLVKTGLDLVTTTAQTCIENQENGLVSNVANSVAKVGDKALKREVLKGATELLTDLTVAATLPIAVPIALATGAIVCAAKPSIAKSCFQWASNAGKGIKALAKEGTKLIVDDNNNRILTSYQRYNKKRLALIDIKDRKRTSKENVSSEERALASFQQQLEQTQIELNHHYRTMIGRFVRALNGSNIFERFFSSIFSFISSNFRREKAIQLSLRTAITARNLSINDCNSRLRTLREELNQLRSEVFYMKSTVAQREQHYRNALNAT